MAKCVKIKKKIKNNKSKALEMYFHSNYDIAYICKHCGTNKVQLMSWVYDMGKEEKKPDNTRNPRQNGRSDWVTCLLRK